MDNNIQLYLGDCLEIMPTLADNSIDMILCDLPYGETGNSWDSVISLDKFCKEYERLIKEDGCIALNCSFRFGVELIKAMPHLYKYDIVWQKDNLTNVPNVNLQPARVHEFILIFGKGRVTNGKRIPMKYFPQKTQGKPYKQKSGKISENWKGGLNNIITDNKGDRHPLTIQYWKRDKNKLHPTQKPLAMIEWLIKSYSSEGDLVLDNCAGSGTTGVACKHLNRRCILIEKEEKYALIASERIKNA